MSADYDIVIVGAGMAGMSAALTAARLGRKVALLSSGMPGGQLLTIEHIDGVPGYAEALAGYDLCPITQEQCDEAGVELIMEACEGIAAAGEGWSVKSESGELSARAVIVASGTSLARLGVPGEEEFAGRGVSECASCDGPLLRGKVAVVAGGGDSAMQEALVVAEHADRVVLVTHGDALRGQAAYRDRVEANDKIEKRFNSEVTAILGEGGVSKVAIRDRASGAQEELEADGVFVFVGLVPNTGFLDGLLPLNGKGHILVDAALRSGVKGIAAAGNARAAGSFRAAGVMGDGALAARTVDDYLATGAWTDPN